MHPPDTDPDAAGSPRSRLFVYNGGFLSNRRVRRILSLAGYDIRLGLPGAGDMVGVWGQSPTAPRGEAIAARRGAMVLRVEDAFLRSLHPGRAGEPPVGLHLDLSGVHFDPATPSDLERLLAAAALDDTALLDRARDGIDRLRTAHLSKYSGVDPALAVPAPGYVLVIDQTRGDASVRASGADAARFREMLVMAQEENPGAPVVIKTHPETRAGFRDGYYAQTDASDRVSLLADPVSPWALLDGAIAVYTVSSQLGFEAILAGHRPRVFGQPFYGGWGLTQDEAPVPRRERRLTRAQLFAAAMILYPVWYDPFRDTLCTLETVLDNLEAQVRAWRQDRHGWVASGIRLWKRPAMQAMFGQHRRVVFTDAPTRGRARDLDRPRMVWAGKAGPDHEGAVRVEDGFLRSRGLGAELVPPQSLVTDTRGIYYDPTRPSDLETLIAERAVLTAGQSRRAEWLIAALTGAGISKYNLEGGLPDLPPGRRILVPGQVADDASIARGATGQVRDNLGLLAAARRANPDAVIVYKPHPDVEACLRPGRIEPADLDGLADAIAVASDPAALIAEVDAVWTLTSLMGFEALLRGVPVTVLGAPFYAGWGLTTDLAPVPERRQARPDLPGLVHAALIDYPRYLDPVTRRICPVEVIVERLAEGRVRHPGPINRGLSKLQGLCAGWAPLWR